MLLRVWPTRNRLVTSPIECVVGFSRQQQAVATCRNMSTDSVAAGTVAASAATTSPRLATPAGKAKQQPTQLPPDVLQRVQQNRAAALARRTKSATKKKKRLISASMMLPTSKKPHSELRRVQQQQQRSRQEHHTPSPLLARRPSASTPRTSTPSTPGMPVMSAGRRRRRPSDRQRSQAARLSRCKVG